MLNVEQGNNGAKRAAEPLTYGAYLRVPELLKLQSPLGVPDVHDEMLFIIVQQAQELWFKQILHEMGLIIDMLGKRELVEASRLLTRVNRIMQVLGQEVAVLETIQPMEFHRFRHLLSPSSGFESAQFRELEVASGLRDATFIKLLEKHMDIEALRSRWPKSLHDAYLEVLVDVSADPVEAVADIYRDPRAKPAFFLLSESLSEYEIAFGLWRFHHIKLVERSIGDHSPGTAGSSGVGYLGRTLVYRFFPELWEARNRLTAGTSISHP